MTKNQRQFTNEYQISTKEYVRIYKLFMQNKPNFGNDKMNITLDMTTKYEISSAGSGQKTKPKQTQLKPIQTQLKPKQTQFNPIQSQFKPNFKLPQTLQRIEKKYLSYGEQAEARRLFARIPAGVQNKLLDTDYSAAEAQCPQRLPIAKLVAEAVSKLPD